MKRQEITLGAIVATPRGMGTVLGFGELVCSSKIQLEETHEIVEYLDKEIRFLCHSKTS